jgi:tRNA U55 pseudouridine synthase TruB
MALRRTGVGGFGLGQAVAFEALEAEGTAKARERLLPPEALVRALARLDATAEEADHFTHGRVFSRSGGIPGEEVAIFAPDGGFLGVARRVESGAIMALRLMSPREAKTPVFA